jgi:hypothetical protein
MILHRLPSAACKTAKTKKWMTIVTGLMTALVLENACSPRVVSCHYCDNEFDVHASTHGTCHILYGRGQLRSI